MVSLGHGLGDDGRSLVSLQPGDLRTAAVGAAALDDFGDSWWGEPFARLCASLESEAQLHLPGRIRTRAELQLVLQNRLRMVDLWKREPAVLRQPVTAPSWLPGSGARAPPCCTSCWPATPTIARRSCGSCCTPSPTPTPPGTCVTTRSRSWTRWCPPSPPCTRTGASCPPNASSPSPTSSPATCTPVSTTWRPTRCGERHRPGPDLRLAQAASSDAAVVAGGRPRWVVKAPSHLSALPLVFATYPTHAS